MQTNFHPNVAPQRGLIRTSTFSDLFLCPFAFGFSASPRLRGATGFLRVFSVAPCLRGGFAFACGSHHAEEAIKMRLPYVGPLSVRLALSFCASSLVFSSVFFGCAEMPEQRGRQYHRERIGEALK